MKTLYLLSAFLLLFACNSKSQCTPPATPTVTSPVNYCQNSTATQLTATGTNLLWSSSTLASGTVGGTATLSNTGYIDASYNNKKINFTTNISNVVIKTVDYTIPAWQAVNGIVLSIYNNAGTIIATSTTNTTLTAGATVVKITSTFNYTIATAGNYSIGVSAGSGNIGYDNPSFPLTEPTGTINITGISSSGYRCFNNITFGATSTSTAPIPSTAVVGSSIYYVTQTVGGCTSLPAAVTVNVTASANISQIPAANLIANYRMEGNANDVTGNNNGTLQNAPTTTVDRFGNAGKAYSFDGSTQYISTAKQYLNPTDFTVSIWFKTSTTTGGRLIGFGTSQTGVSSQYDRHIYMTNGGQLYFGVYPSTVKTINSTASYNDNKWHLATATLSSVNGMILYVDGTTVASDPTTTAAENYTGYWRIGYDNNSGWTSQPSSFFFNGILDDALIYSTALSATQIATLYTSPDGAGNSGPVCLGSSINLTATTVSGATYAWTGPNSFTTASQNPSLTYTTAGAGTYTLQVSSNGCISTAYTNVVSSSNAGQWTGNTSTDWSDATNWCSGTLPTSTTNVVIASTAARQPTISSSVSCNSLTINSGATLATALAGTLNIAGTLTNNGTMTNNGTTNFNGTSGQQTFSGITSFYNITVSNSSGIILPASITINNNVLITAGVLNANNFNITVKGSWTNNVSSGAFTAGTGTVTFSGTTAQTIGGTASTTFNKLTIAGTANTVSLAANAIISSDLTVTSGTFDLSTFTANRTTSGGGTLTVANNAILKIGGTNTYPTNYSVNTLVVASTVEYAGTNQTVATQTYGNLKLTSSSGAAVKTLPAVALTVLGNLTSAVGTGTSVTFTATSTVNVSGNVSIGASTTFNGGGSYHTIGGNWTNDGTFNPSTGTINFAGHGAQVGGSGTLNFYNLTVTASTVSFSNVAISVASNLTTSGSGSFSQASGGTITMSGSGKIISGTGMSINNLAITGSITSQTSLTITGNLSVSGTFTATTGTTTMSGASKIISGAGTKTFGTLSINGSITTAVDFSISSALTVAGSLTASAGTATFTGTSTLSGTPNLFNVTINGTSLQLSTNSVLGIASAMTISAGTLNVTSSTPNTVNFNSSGAQNINAITYNNLVVSNGNTKTLAGNITTNNNITISTGTTLNPGSYTISVYGNWANNGSFTPATSTVQFLGAATAFIDGATTFNILTNNTTNSITELILHDNISSATVNMINGTISTGIDTLTITGTRTGNGFIYGNIKRTHAFTTGVAYAFEGPNNTVNFSAVSSVTSITVSATKGSVNDFPFGNAIGRTYKIAVPSGTYTATLRLHYEDNELNGNPENDMGIWKYDTTQWIPVGKTANNSSSNYVEQSGLTNITDRWTISINPSVVLWNGSVSTDWNTAANWTVYVGSASTPPSATDVAVVGGIPFTYQPTISTNVSVKNLVFGTTQAITLSLATGGSLNSGDMQGVWQTNVTHTINANNQTITVNGDMSLSDGTSGHAINLNIGTGIVNVLGKLNQTGGANIIFTGAGNLNIAKDFNYVNGIFSPATSTVTYNGVDNQLIGAVNYNNLIINNAAASPSINSTTNISGNLTITAGELDIYDTTIIAGNVTIASGALLDNHSILHVGGNWVNNGSFTGNGTNVVFDGTGTQTISSTTFNNLEFNKPVGSLAVLAGDVTLKGNLVGTSGTLDIGTYFFNRDVVGGSATMSDAATLIIGTDNAPTKFANYYMAPNSTVIFNGTGAQHLLLPGLTYGNLIFRNSGTKTLYSETTISGDLTIESGATFNAGANTITLNGNWTNNGTFIPSTSTILLTGTTKNVSGNTTFKLLTVNGSYTFLNNNTIDSSLIINATGSLSGGSSITTTMNGDLVNKGILYTLGTTTFTGNVLQTLSLIDAVQTVAITVNFNGSVSPVLNSTSAPQYGFLNINNTGGINPSVGWNILYGLTVGSGASFNGGPSNHTLLGYLTNNGTITSSGTFSFTPASAATINMGTNFTSTGRVIFGGAGAITLAGTPVSFKNITVNNTNVSGVSPSSDWTLTNNLNISSGSILNTGSHNYFIGGNIVNNGTINSSTSSFTMNGTATQDIYSASAFNNLTINKSADIVTLTNDITVNGALNFISGKIQTGTNKIIQSATATVTGASQQTGWVNGNLQKDISTGAVTKAFEIGDANVYTPATITFANVTGSGSIAASSVQGDHPYITSSVINLSENINRYWSFINNGTTFTTYSATVKYSSSDIDAGASSTSFGGSIYTGSSWVLPTTASANDTTTTITGATLFGDLAIGQICNLHTAIAYNATPYCAGAGIATVTLTGNTGGVFTSSPDLSLNASSGSVTLATSIPGTYNVTYSLESSGQCQSFITSASITINPVPTAEGLYAGSPYCSNAGIAYPTGSGTGGGKFSSTTGLVIDSLTGGIDLASSIAGTYTVTYTIAATGGCDAFSWTTDVTIIAAPSAVISYPNSPYCSGIATASVMQSGTNGGIYSSTSGLVIDSISGLVNIAASQVGTYTVTYTVAATNPCGQYQTTANISIFAAAWTGAINTDWDNAGNWSCDGVPSSAVDILIPSGLSNYPVINNTRSVNDITIQNGASLTVTDGLLKIGGAINNLGTFNTSSGTIEMNGTSQQIIPANTFVNNSIFNLIISNDVVLEGTQKIINALSFGTSNHTLYTGGYLILSSTATGTARLADITNGGNNIGNSILGDVTVERYIPAKRAWRLLGAPLSSSGAPTINAAWQEGVTSGNPSPGYGMQIPGGTEQNGFDQGVNNNSSLKAYSNSVNNFVALATTNIPITSYSGYFIFVRGDRGTNLMQGTAAPLTNTTLRMKGKLNTGAFNVDVDAANCTLVGNPYAATINFHSVTKNNVNDKLYIWDPKLAGANGLGGYVTLIWNGAGYDATSSVSPVSQYIPSGEAFFVESLDGENPGTLTFKETDKTGSGSDLQFRPIYGNEKMRVNLISFNSDGTTFLSDGVLTTYGDGNSNLVDRNDAIKHSNTSENIGIARDGKMLSIERRQTIETTDTTFFNLFTMKKQTYKFQITLEAMDRSGLLAVIKDNYLSAINNTPLNMNGTTEITFSLNNDPASYALNRFSIVFTKLNPLPVTFKSINASVHQQNVLVKWEAENQTNTKYYIIETSISGTNFTKTDTLIAKAGDAVYNWLDKNAGEGFHYYRIRSISADGKENTSSIVKVNMDATSGTITAYSSVIKNGSIDLQLNNMKQGKYAIRLLNMSGQVILVNTIDHATNNTTEKVILKNNIVSGMYKLEIIAPDNKKTIINLLK